MRRIFELLVTWYDAFVIVLIFCKSGKVSVQALQSYREIDLTAANGTFSSPYYPMIYPKNLTWIWIIRPSQYRVVLETIDMDLYRCYVFDKDQECSSYDHVTINGNGLYCNWYKPTKIIVFPPWTKTTITFTSLNARDECRGRGFKIFYKLVLEASTTTRTPETIVLTHFTKHPTEDDDKETARHVTLPIVLGVVFAVIIAVILNFLCCRRRSRNRQSPRRMRNPDARARARESRNRLLGIQVETGQGRSIQEQPIRYLDTRLRNVDYNAILLNRGPPPIYDEIYNEVSNRSHNLEFPPSYEVVISEESTERETLNQATAVELSLQRDIQGNHGDSQGNPRELNLESNVPSEATNAVLSLQRDIHGNYGNVQRHSSETGVAILPDRHVDYQDNSEPVTSNDTRERREVFV